jgi:electron transport complex protein RnfD
VRFPLYSSPHGIQENHVTRLMAQVLFALIPGILASWWFFGWGVLIQIAIATLTAVVAEIAVIRLRKRDALPVIKDLSAVVTAVLFALAIPPFLPWWMTVAGILFGIIIVKQLYGGLQLVTTDPGLIASLSIIFTSVMPESLSWDALTMATPLDEMRTRLEMGQMIYEIREIPGWGDFGGIGREQVAFCFMIGGIFMLWRKVISWHIPLSMIAAMVILSSATWLAEPDVNPVPVFHIIGGGFMLGAFFIATDPVSAATTKKGQIIYGALIGILIFIIRNWGGYPDAVAFAVLLMNMAAPTIDYYTAKSVWAG